MALNPEWVQDLLECEVTLAAPSIEIGGSSVDVGTDSGNIGRAYVDGVLVVYDPEDVPAWLSPFLMDGVRDDDGNTKFGELRAKVW